MRDMKVERGWSGGLSNTLRPRNQTGYLLLLRRRRGRWVCRMSLLLMWLLICYVALLCCYLTPSLAKLKLVKQEFDIMEGLGQRSITMLVFEARSRSLHSSDKAWPITRTIIWYGISGSISYGKRVANDSGHNIHEHGQGRCNDDGLSRAQYFTSTSGHRATHK